jgi:hypothetical protein
MFFFEPDATGLGTLPPSLLAGVSPKCSFVVESRYPLPASAHGADAVVAVRNKYLDVREKAIAAAAAGAAVGAAKQALTMASNKGADKSVFDLALSVLKLPTGKAAADSQAELQAELLKRQAALAAAEQALQGAMSGLTKAVDTPNLMVTRWARDDNMGVGTNVGPYASGSVDHQDKVSGVLVLGDVRVRSMSVGEDFYRLLMKVYEEDGGLQAAVKLKNLGIVTYVVEAKHIAYISERDYLTDAALSLGVTRDQLASLLDANTKIEIAANLSTAANLSNTGVFSAPETTVQKFAFMQPNDHFGFIKTGLLGLTPAEKGYSTVFAVRATVEWPMVTALAAKERSTPIARTSSPAADACAETSSPSGLMTIAPAQ